ncbi:hypothetical protein [Frigoribacterium sp. NBH87]|uniref:hypothetical protein n=1 Tax=Frigoribacterium sp. NBH87 TaxID=2596916 RepID=UPI00162911A7|nr:hypothetical protein [Frigoribacterium sp. NBH87]
MKKFTGPAERSARPVPAGTRSAPVPPTRIRPTSGRPPERSLTMYFAHAPKLVLTGSSDLLRPLGDRAAVLGAEVVVVDADPGLPVGDVDGFDVAVVGVGGVAEAARDLGRATEVLAPGLRRGALLIVSSPAGLRSLESEGRAFAACLAERSGLDLGDEFSVVAKEGDAITWHTGEEGAEAARYLVSRIAAVPTV